MRLFSDSVNYHCTLHQSKKDLPYLILLHGFMGSEEVFKPLIKSLNEFCNPVTIDLAGHGKSHSPADSKLFSAERQCRQLKSILDRLQFQNLYLYGYSMGGRLAFQLISRYPEYFKGAVIESAHCGIRTEEERRNRTRIDEERAKNIEGNFDAFLRKWQQMPLFKHSPKREKARYNDIIVSQNPAVMAASLREFGAGVMPRVCDEIPNSQIPIILIAGALDIKYVEIMTEIGESYDQAKLYIVKGAGHRVHTDQPDEMINIIKNFMNQR
jgi:2-succinyl-6-hydroxy-2,4-cyclohexadiene-1-carboxylate synthase